jgi:hypothetical protein
MSGAPLLEFAMLEASIAGMPGQSATQSRLESESLWLTSGKMRRGSLIPKCDRSDKEKRVWSWPETECRKALWRSCRLQRKLDRQECGWVLPQAPDFTATAPIGFHSRTPPEQTGTDGPGQDTRGYAHVQRYRHSSYF